ncbi:Ig-like domain-containing protein, partial [Cochleicola gelatinilyticus]|uniref:Ig-like domain-containing protein n=1 Tax=Cochleicola gelatinilyticus TaxID=1763537 RepID=UPI000A88F4BD
INNTYVNTPVSGDVGTNDENPDGPADSETYTLITGATNGSVTLNPDGTYTYTPNADYVGEDTFVYEVCDGGNPSACDQATVYIEVLPLNSSANEAPIANADTNTTEVGVPIDGNVLPNDFDPDGDPITVTDNTDPANGTVVMNPDGTYTYIPNTGFEGEDSFEYTICDNGNPALCDTATVTITVIPDTGNITIANDDAYNGLPNEDITGNVLDNDSDPEGNLQVVNVILSPVSGPSNGSIVINEDGTFTYTPNDGYTGTDQFVYAIQDNGGPIATDQATVYITISPNGDGNEILAIDDINNTYVNTPVSGDVGTNDDNTDGPAGTEVYTLVTAPSEGTVTLNPDGTYTYTPNANYVGEDTFVYEVCDGGNPIACDQATVYIEILPDTTPGNEPPVANADTNVTEVDVPVNGTVISNDFDPDGDEIIVTDNTDPANGTVVVNPDGTYTYTPNPGYTGEDTFEYTICDDGTPALCDTATVIITIVDNDGENITVANDDAYNGLPDEDITGNVLDNDNDPEGDTQMVNTTPVSGPSNGTVVLNADGTFVYTPNPGATGTDQFVYEVCDDGTPSACDQATVYITIPPNGAGNEILAIDDINNTYIDLPVSGDVSTNDENPDGPDGTEEFTLITGTINGTVVLNLDGTYTYTPNSGYIGEDTFVYQICDAGNPVACDTATVYIEILPINSPANEAPIANADTNTTEVGVPIDGNVLPNDFDPDGDPITITGNTQPSNGTVVLNPDGSYTYTPNTGFEGEDSFEYTICDNGTPALCDTTTVTITVIPDTGNITIANDDAYNGILDMVIAGNVLDNDSDPEGNLQTVDVALTPVSGPTSGTVIITADGEFEYTPNPGFFGTDQFVYAIQDNGGPIATDQATVYITIAASNGNEILAIDDINDTFVNLPVDGNVLTNDDNIDGPEGTETVTLVSGPTNGTLVLNPNGTYTYTPDTDFVGEDVFIYEVCDAGNPIACDQATVTIEVIGDPLAANDPPIANNDTNVTEIDVPVTGTVLSNDFDPDGDPITVTDNTQPSNGTVVVNTDGTYTYTPNPGYSGEDSFEYTICDNGTPALCDTATVYIQIIPDNGNITVANDDAYNGEFNTDITGNVLDNDNDPEGDTQIVDVTLSPVSGPSNGTVVINPDGSFTYTPNADFTGTDQFVYAIEDDNADVATDQATVYITIIDTPNPSIAIVKEGELVDGFGGGCPNVGDIVTYTFMVRNLGDVPLDTIELTDPLLEAPNPVVPIDFVGGDTNANDILEDDEIWTYTADYVLTQADIDAGEVINQATATGLSPADEVASDLSHPTLYTDDAPTIVELCQTPFVGLIKEGQFMDNNGDGCANVGEEILYSFTVFNLGNITLSDITITDDLVAVLGGPITLAPQTNDDTSFSAVYTITQADIDAGLVINQATVTATLPDGITEITDLSDPVSEFDNNPTETDLSQCNTIGIVKSATINDDNGDGCADVDETVTYTFSVRNTGNRELTNISITDPLLEAPNPVVTIEFVDGDTDGDDVLDFDETWTYTAEYVVTQADVDAGEIVNQATANAFTVSDNEAVTDLSHPTSYTADAPTVTGICNMPMMEVQKIGLFRDDNGDGFSEVGEHIDYQFIVTNTGDVTLTNIVIEDELPGIELMGGPIAVLLPGEVDDSTFTAVYTITQEDIDNLEVVNQALAISDEGVTDLSDDPNNGTNEDLEGDGEPDDPTVTIIPGVGGEDDLVIYNGITPDGDGLNDFFNVMGIENFPDNNMKIFNRWGVLVWETDGYGGTDGKQNVFEGISNGRSTIREGEELPTGTYYYVLVRTEPVNGETLKNSGYLYINR